MSFEAFLLRSPRLQAESDFRTTIQRNEQIKTYEMIQCDIMLLDIS